MQSIPTEKVPEPAMSKDNILQPLKFLLAARRGVRMDPLFSELNVPEERNIHYHGISGFSPQNSTPFWTKFIIYVGYTTKT
jgi:hypothetical protein